MQLIPLGNQRFAKVDDSDYPTLAAHKWHYTSRGYAGRMIRRSDGSRRILLMHHAISGKPLTGLQTDHINRDTLDNRRANLRSVSQAQNNMNRRKFANKTSTFKGVYRTRNQWAAGISVDGQWQFIGLFPSERTAAIAYDLWAHDLYRQNGAFNFC